MYKVVIIVRIVRGISGGDPLSVSALYIKGQIVRIVRRNSGGGPTLRLCHQRVYGRKNCKNCKRNFKGALCPG